MTNIKKLLFGLMIAFAIALMQMGPAAAQESTPPGGTVDSITLETDTATNTTTVLVTFTDETNTSQTVRLSLDTAESLGLVTVDPTTGEAAVNEAAIGTTVVIDPATVITDTTPPEAEAQHPVGLKLSDFFGELFGVDYAAIMEVHDGGVGFGVIAQALWMTEKLGGDASTFDAIIEAKQNGDYSSVTLPDGSTPQNWGQFRKAVMGGDRGNLGSIMSGKADNGQSTEVTANSESSNNGKGNGNGNGNDKGKDNSNKGKGKNK